MILLVVTPWLDILLFLLILGVIAHGAHDLHPPVWSFAIGLLPSLVVALRIINPAPLLLIDADTIHLCGITSIHRRLPLASLRGIRHSIWSPSHSPDLHFLALDCRFRAPTKTGKSGWRKRTVFIPAALLPQPIDVLLVRLERYPAVSGLVDLPPYWPTTDYDSLVRSRRTPLELSWPWVWSLQSIMTGALYAAGAMSVFLVCALTVPASSSTWDILALPFVLWPLFAGGWLTWHDHGNMTAGTFASFLGAYGMMIIAQRFLHFEDFPTLSVSEALQLGGFALPILLVSLSGCLLALELRSDSASSHFSEHWRRTAMPQKTRKQRRG